jgi:hypothetical protein
MKFNLKSKTLYTDKGDFIKSLSCPKKIDWELLSDTGDNKRFCNQCANYILDSGHFSDDVLLKIVQENPNTCLMVDINQKNLTILNNECI